MRYGLPSSIGQTVLACFTPLTNGGDFRTEGERNSEKPFEPLCNICGEPVRIEEAKTDECGKPVHGECYVRRFMNADSISTGNT